MLSVMIKNLNENFIFMQNEATGNIYCQQLSLERSFALYVAVSIRYFCIAVVFFLSANVLSQQSFDDT